MRDREASLLDIVAYAYRVERYVRDVSHGQFMADVGVQDQVIRCLCVIGEAAKRTPEQTRERYPAVPWEQIVSMRNRLAHEYDGVDMEMVWLTATADLPRIVSLLSAGS